MKLKIIKILKELGFWMLFYIGVRYTGLDGIREYIGSALLCIWCIRVYRGLK